MRKTTKQRLPRGWTEDRVRKLAKHYDTQTEDEGVAEIEAALHAEGHTVMVVPTELVPEIVKLINKKRPA
jgi:tRNA1(Val) A37 N6-methylase TrmN6